jgi:D-sedoheptulose 7-phosphate isomerase
MTFPDIKFQNVSDYMDAYAFEHQTAMNGVDREALSTASDILETAYLQNNTVFVCGNGGSAAIANHMVCDHGKLIGTDTLLKVRIHSLCNSAELMTAIANDISYEEIFSYPLRSMGQDSDVLLTISGSGQSPNVIKATEAAKELGMHVIAFTGFSGGKSAELSDVNVHVPSDNYGIVEDIHQGLMQVIAQFIRMKNMEEGLISQRRF